MKHFFTSILFLLIFKLTVAQSNFIKDSLDIYIKREMVRWNLPGLAIAIVKDGKVMVMKGYGYADASKKLLLQKIPNFKLLLIVKLLLAHR